MIGSADLEGRVPQPGVGGAAGGGGGGGQEGRRGGGLGGGGVGRVRLVQIPGKTYFSRAQRAIVLRVRTEYLLPNLLLPTRPQGCCYVS